MKVDNNNLRVGLFNDNFFPIVDGVVRVVDNYASELTRRNTSVKVFCPRYKVYDDSMRNYPIRRVSSIKLPGFEYNIPAPKFTKGLKKELLNENYSIFHAHSPFFMGRYALKLAHKKHIPIIATFHSKFYDDFLQITKSKLMAKWLTRYVVRFFEKCDEVWTVNESSEKTLYSYGYKGYIHVIPNGTHFIYPHNALELRKKQREEWNITEQENVLLFVGHLIWQKNIRVILDSLKILKNEGFKFKMFFVGEGGNEKAVRIYSEKLGLGDCVTFLGALKEKDVLQKVYAACDLFYFPSLYDTFSLVLREASVMKIPSLLAEHSNSSEQIIDGENGFVTTPTCECMASKIKEIFAHKDKLKIVGENASQTIPIPWQNILDLVEERYQKVITNYNNKQK